MEKESATNAAEAPATVGEPAHVDLTLESAIWDSYAALIHHAVRGHAEDRKAVQKAIRGCWEWTKLGSDECGPPQPKVFPTQAMLTFAEHYTRKAHAITPALGLGWVRVDSSGDKGSRTSKVTGARDSALAAPVEELDDPPTLMEDDAEEAAEEDCDVDPGQGVFEDPEHDGDASQGPEQASDSVDDEKQAPVRLRAAQAAFGEAHGFTLDRFQLLKLDDEGFLEDAQCLTLLLLLRATSKGAKAIRAQRAPKLAPFLALLEGASKARDSKASTPKGRLPKKSIDVDSDPTGDFAPEPDADGEVPPDADGVDVGKGPSLPKIRKVPRDHRLAAMAWLREQWTSADSSWLETWISRHDMHQIHEGYAYWVLVWQAKGLRTSNSDSIDGDDESGRSLTDIIPDDHDLWSGVTPLLANPHSAPPGFKPCPPLSAPARLRRLASLLEDGAEELAERAAWHARVVADIERGHYEAAGTDPLPALLSIARLVQWAWLQVLGAYPKAQREQVLKSFLCRLGDLAELQPRTDAADPNARLPAQAVAPWGVHLLIGLVFEPEVLTLAKLQEDTGADRPVLVGRKVMGLWRAVEKAERESAAPAARRKSAKAAKADTTGHVLEAALDAWTRACHECSTQFEAWQQQDRKPSAYVAQARMDELRKAAEAALADYRAALLLLAGGFNCEALRPGRRAAKTEAADVESLFAGMPTTADWATAMQRLEAVVGPDQVERPSAPELAGQLLREVSEAVTSYRMQLVADVTHVKIQQGVSSWLVDQNLQMPWLSPAECTERLFGVGAASGGVRALKLWRGAQRAVPGWSETSTLYLLSASTLAAARQSPSCLNTMSAVPGLSRSTPGIASDRLSQDQAWDEEHEVDVGPAGQDPDGRTVVSRFLWRDLKGSPVSLVEKPRRPLLSCLSPNGAGGTAAPLAPLLSGTAPRVSEALVRPWSTWLAVVLQVCRVLEDYEQRKTAIADAPSLTFETLDLWIDQALKEDALEALPALEALLSKHDSPAVADACRRALRPLEASLKALVALVRAEPVLWLLCRRTMGAALDEVPFEAPAIRPLAYLSIAFAVNTGAIPDFETMVLSRYERFQQSLAACVKPAFEEGVDPSQRDVNAIERAVLSHLLIGTRPMMRVIEEDPTNNASTLRRFVREPLRAECWIPAIPEDLLSGPWPPARFRGPLYPEDWGLPRSGAGWFKYLQFEKTPWIVLLPGEKSLRAALRVEAGQMASSVTKFGALLSRLLPEEIAPARASLVSALLAVAAVGRTGDKLLAQCVEAWLQELLASHRSSLKDALGKLSKEASPSVENRDMVAALAKRLFQVADLACDKHVLTARAHYLVSLKCDFMAVEDAFPDFLAMVTHQVPAPEFEPASTIEKVLP